jgi:hypothetical protein
MSEYEFTVNKSCKEIVITMIDSDRWWSFPPYEDYGVIHQQIADDLGVDPSDLEVFTD